MARWSVNRGRHCQQSYPFKSTLSVISQEHDIFSIATHCLVSCGLMRQISAFIRRRVYPLYPFISFHLRHGGWATPLPELTSLLLFGIKRKFGYLSASELNYIHYNTSFNRKILNSFRNYCITIPYHKSVLAVGAPPVAHLHLISICEIEDDCYYTDMAN